jgi:hypothetical protein
MDDKVSATQTLTLVLAKDIPLAKALNATLSNDTTSDFAIGGLNLKDGENGIVLR